MDTERLWSHVEEILHEATDCERHCKDENAWCDDVVRPLLKLETESKQSLHNQSFKVINL